jgi:hypothetical protein
MMACLTSGGGLGEELRTSRPAAVTRPRAATIPTTSASCGAITPIPGWWPGVEHGADQVATEDQRGGEAGAVDQLQTDAREQHPPVRRPDKLDASAVIRGSNRSRVGRSCASGRRSAHGGGRRPVGGWFEVVHDHPAPSRHARKSRGIGMTRL